MYKNIISDEHLKKRGEDAQLRVINNNKYTFVHQYQFSINELSVRHNHRISFIQKLNHYIQ